MDISHNCEAYMDGVYDVIRNVNNDYYAKDTSKKIRAVVKMRGEAGEHLASNPPYESVGIFLKRSRAPDKLACQGRRERLQQAPVALAQPGFGGGLLSNRRKSEMAPAAYRSGGHPALVIVYKSG